MADFLEAKVREIEERLRELQPLIEEFHRLEAASAALNGVSAAAVSAAAPRRRASSAANGTGTGRRGRARGGRSGENTRAAQTVELVRANPGITIPELAGHMGIKPNYLYRVLPQLADEGKLRRDGKGWHPA